MSEIKDMRVEELLPLAEQGDAEAQMMLGICCMYGRGAAQDLARGVQWYRRAAEQGNAWAGMLLAECCANGWGVPKDYVRAAEWYRKSAAGGCYAAELKLLELQEEMDLLARAERGDTRAQCRLGNKYIHGEGVPQDYAQGVRWLRRAAEQGEPGAQYGLGRCYEKGRGVAQDFAQAAEWYRKAAEQGYRIPGGFAKIANQD